MTDTEVATIDDELDDGFCEDDEHCDHHQCDEDCEWGQLCDIDDTYCVCCECCCDCPTCLYNRPEYQSPKIAEMREAGVLVIPERDYHQEAKDDRAMGRVDADGNQIDPDPPDGEA